MTFMLELSYKGLYCSVLLQNLKALPSCIQCNKAHILIKIYKRPSSASS
jgi:hypothetical protein